MPRIPIVFPMGGRSDSAAHSQNPELFTRQARNIRIRDPVSGRMRGAQREGMTKWNPNVIGASRVKALCSTAIDDRKVAYSFSAGAVGDVWSAILPSKLNSVGAAVDQRGNVYALDGSAGIAKLNSVGRVVMKIALPVTDPQHVVRAITVDSSGRIFAAVSSGGDVEKAAMWCILQLEGDQYFILWTLTPGAYTERLKVFRGAQLYAAHNYPQENRARVVVYENIGLDPSEARRTETVAFPIHDMDVGEDGSFYCASPEQITQQNLRYRPAFPGAQGSYHAPVVGWTPRDLTNSRARIWGWWEASDIDETDLEQAGDVATLNDGQQILRWRDRSGNNRHWYAGKLEDTSEFGPTYAKHGPGGLPAARFLNTATIRQSLVTLGNSSIEKAAASQQRSAIPEYTGGMFALFILMRITEDTLPGAPAPRVVFFADNEAAAPASDHSLWINRACGAVVPGTFDSNNISYFATTDAAPDDGQCAAADQPIDAQYGGENTNCVLVTILWDGKVDPSSDPDVGGDAAKTRCIVRYNGVPIDMFEGQPLTSLKANWLAYTPAVAAAAANRFNGEVCEILSLDRIDRFDDVTEPKIATHDKLEIGSPGAAQTDNEVARIEAYMLGQRGLGQLLPNQGNAHPHFYRSQDASARFSVPTPVNGGRNEHYQALIRSFAVTTKHSVDGALVWTCAPLTMTAVAGTGGAIGYSVRARKIESDGKIHVWMTGPPLASGVDGSTGDVDMRKVIDSGSDFSDLAADGAWRHSYSDGSDVGYAYLRIDADQFGNVFVPGHDLAAGAVQRSLHAFKKDPDGGGLAVQKFEVFLAGSAFRAFAAVLPPDILTPDYRTDLASADKIAEAVYLCTPTQSVGTEAAVFRIRIVTTNAVASGTPRSVHTIAVTEDDIRLVTAAANSIPTGGSAVINATAQYVQALRAGDDIVILDGIKYWAYKIRDGTVEELVSTSAGEIPPRGKLAMYWRHRLVVGNFADAAGGYAASRLGNIRDWNQNPGSLPTGEQIHTSTQAFSGSATRAGEAEDSITALIPVWDDLAFIGCESRILRLTGDPQDGGNIHKITDSMGIPFGDAWCKDQSGRVFVFGNAPPGLYMLMPEGDPIALSRHTLEESEFAEIDFSTHRIVLAWNPTARGVHIWQVAWGSSSIVDHWFWEEKTHRFVKSPPLWTDRYGLAGLQPTSYAYLGGDDTRGLLVGCDDGYIRMLDPEALSDDGTLIDSFVTIGPITPQGGPELDWRLIDVEIALADDQGGCRLEAFVSNTADSMGPIAWARDLKPGMNFCRVRLKGSFIWLRLRGVGIKRWAYEQGRATIVATSRTQEAGELS